MSAHWARLHPERRSEPGPRALASLRSGIPGNDGGIAIRSVTKRYRDGTIAVRDFDLEIGDSEFMILVGPSGCGKTTLLWMIAGLEAITAGEIEIRPRR